MIVNVKQSEFELSLFSEFRNPNFKGFRGVIVVDGICGIGKTTGIFEHINRSIIKTNPSNKVMYVGPYLDELTRVQQYFAEKFHKPKATFKSDGFNSSVTKLNGLKKLLSQNKHIAITHKLFESIDEECIDLIKSQNYNLVMDEEPNVVQTLKDRYTYKLKNGIEKDLSDGDISELIRLKALTLNGSTVVDNGLNLERYSDLLVDVKNKKIKLYTKKRKEGVEDIYVWSQNPEVFKSFNTVHVLTYLFSGSFLQGYFNINKIPYFIDNLTSQHFYENPNNHPFHQLIKLAPTVDENLFPGLESVPLSSTWFKRYRAHLKSDPNLNNILKTKISSFLRQQGVHKEVKMWTTLKKHRKFLTDNGYKEAFVRFNARATNEYRNRSQLVYAVNTYPNPILINYFSINKSSVSQDSYATSALIQWVFRSQLRDGLPIKIFIPSNRMHDLLKTWILKYKLLYTEAESFKKDYHKLSKSKTPQEPPTFTLNEYLKLQPGLKHLTWLEPYAKSL
jgi:hypothetical protein